MVHQAYLSGMDDAHVARTIQMKVLISKQEKRWLVDLSDDLGLTVSDVIRQFIRAAAKNAALDRSVDDDGLGGSWVKDLPGIDPARGGKTTA